MRVILAGHGAVGRAFHDLVATTRKDVQVVGVARSDRAAADPAGVPVEPAWEEGRTIEDLLETVEADALVEVIPTNMQTGEPGATMVRAALERGLHVVTADKGPITHHYHDLQALAEARGLALRFEATVAGAIPTLNLARACLPGNPITRIDGILNGTSNFILTRMREDGNEFEQALEEARELGYAEADPTNDVDGWDAAAKVTILANAALGMHLKLDEVDRVGIRDVTAGAVRLAREDGYAVRLLASVDTETGAAAVRPRLVDEGSPLNVDGVLNVVRHQTRYGGPVTLSGRGAGGVETASALLADVLGLPDTQ